MKKARYKYQIWNHLKNEIVRQKNLTFYYKNSFFDFVSREELKHKEKRLIKKL